MKEKIKKILFGLKIIIIRILEIGTVIWAINGMLHIVNLNFAKGLQLSEHSRLLYLLSLEKGVNLFLIPLLFYFLSAILILYLLRKYEGKS